MRRFLYALSGLLLLSPGFAQPLQQGLNARPNAPVVDLGYAQYAGIIDNATGNANFLGLRYAAPPTGSLRWRAPQPPASTPGIQPAIEPPSCYNAPSYGVSPTNPYRNGTSQSVTGNASHLNKRAAPVQSSEDCLFLNVFAPNVNQTELLPVIVYIHGGGYEAGQISVFGGNSLIQESGQRVVIVTPQYRLGVFGFLSGEAVKQGGDLNVGLLDQSFALQWVQQHISKFGGDPYKVTIWGTSAGAGSVLQHVIAQDGNTKPPLFRGAMTSSTFLPSQYPYNGAVPEAVYKEVISQAGCSSSQDTLQCLRNTDVASLESVNSNIATTGTFFGTFIFVPVIDGTFITKRPSEILRTGKLNGEMLLSMTNTNEGYIFVNQSSSTSVTNYVAQLFPLLGQKEIDAAAAQYVGLGTPIEQASAIMGEAIFVCPTYFLMRGFRGRSFKGEFAIPPGYHGNDVLYYFLPSQAPYHNKAFINAFSQAFTDFTIALNPNFKSDPTNITPKWDKWGFGKNEMLFNKTEAGAPLIEEIKTSPELLARCKFWESVSELTALGPLITLEKMREKRGENSKKQLAERT